MHSPWFRSTFLRVSKFLEMKDGGPNFWGEPILKNVWIIWSSMLYFNFKSFLDPNSSSFIRFQSILHESRVLFPGSRNFCKLKRVALISERNQFCRMSQLFGPLLYFNLRSSTGRNSSSFIKFWSFLHESRLLFLKSSNFEKWKTGDLISGSKQIGRMSQLYGPLFCISILKVLSTYIIPHSLDFTHFYMNHGYFSQSPEISEK